MTNAVAERETERVTAIRSRLPMPAGMVDDFDARKWRVLCETTFPMAKTAEAIVMAFDYCKARGLDVFKKPVHIVPMWNSSLGREVETVWPGINEVQITAARTGAWAGMDEPKWGPEIERTFKGRKKQKGNWVDTEATVTFPEWCEVTVYRVVGGMRCAFTEPVYWIEAYSRAGGSELPTDMWIKRPRGQLHKVAKAASLRAAFPEEGEYTAEEMEGKEIEQGGVVIEHEAPQKVMNPDTGRMVNPRSAQQAKKRGIWDALMQEIGECETALRLHNLREAYRSHSFAEDNWPREWIERAEEEFEKRFAELSSEDLTQTLEDSVAMEGEAEPRLPQPGTRADYIAACSVTIHAFRDPKALLEWWNDDEEKAKRRRFSLNKAEVDELKGQVMEWREELEAREAER